MPGPRFHLPAKGPVALAVIVAACGPAATLGPPASIVPSAVAPSATAGTAPTAGSAPTGPAATAAPTLPAGVLALPTAFAGALEPGTYLSSPPFELRFTFEVGEPGWVAGHLNGEFFDVQRFEGEPGVGLPARLVGFGHPDTFRGETDVPAVELTPGEAVGLLAARDSLESSNVADLALLGLDAARVDLHSKVGNSPIFGGDDGAFGLGPELDLRLVVLPIDPGLLVIAVMAPPGELDAGWDEALPIIESIDLDP